MWKEITFDMTTKEKWAIVGYAVTIAITGVSFYVMIWAILTLGEI